jgi:hypothetical protein
MSYQKCTVRDGRFVEPCVSLRKVIDGARVKLVEYTDFNTMQPSRSFVSIHAGEFKKNGIVLNCCPLCGARIDAPVLNEDDEAA